MSLLEPQSTWNERDSKSMQQIFVDTTGIVSFIGSDVEVKLSGPEWENYTVQEYLDSLIFPEPVYVEEYDGVERLVYNSSKMKLGELYKIRWNNQDYALRKTDKEIEILKFYPDQKDEY